VRRGLSSLERAQSAEAKYVQIPAIGLFERVGEECLYFQNGLFVRVRAYHDSSMVARFLEENPIA
jgi:hypothetical protein